MSSKCLMSEHKWFLCLHMWWRVHWKWHRLPRLDWSVFESRIQLLIYPFCVSFVYCKDDTNTYILQSSFVAVVNICHRFTSYFCLDIKECDNSPCHANATCLERNGSFQCDCKSGFTGNGTECQGNMAQMNLNANFHCVTSCHYYCCSLIRFEYCIYIQILFCLL